MNREFDKSLKNAIKGLPEHIPDERLWNRIDAALQFNEKLNESVSQLPEFPAPEVVWQRIDIQINRKKTSQFRLKPVISILAAACIAGLIIIGYYNMGNSNEEITITEDNSEEWEMPVYSNNENSASKAVEYIDKQCSKSPYLCAVPEFIDLKEQLKDVNKELENLQFIVQQTGTSPNIEKTRVKLENMKSQIIKDLVKQISS